jgi:acyl-CoA hydrolase
VSTGGDLARAEALAAFRPGGRVYIQGAGGEPLALREMLTAAPEVLADVSLTSCLLPGMNEFDYAALNPTSHMTTFMLPAAFRASFTAGRVNVRPMPYSQIAADLAGDSFDLAIFQVTPPDAEGLCGFGPCADFAGLVFPRAKRRVAFINPALPPVARGPRVRREAIDIAIDAPGAFITAAEEAPSAEHSAIAALVAAQVPDGAALQSGIGGAPAAALAGLTGHRGLVVRSGMVTEGYRELATAGALADGAAHITGLAIGSPDFMAWAAGAFVFADAFTTHGAEGLAATPRFTAINSALEVDLFGQVNLEWREGRLFGGLGGAPDFSRAARRSEGGRSILALPATAKGGRLSRIVPRLATPTISLSRDDADLIITEHGAADLRGADLQTRACRLIAIAAPDQREGLERAWRDMGPF